MFRTQNFRSGSGRVYGSDQFLPGLYMGIHRATEITWVFIKQLVPALPHSRLILFYQQIEH